MATCTHICMLQMVSWPHAHMYVCIKDSMESMTFKIITPSVIFFCLIFVCLLLVYIVLIKLLLIIIVLIIIVLLLLQLQFVTIDTTVKF